MFAFLEYIFVYCLGALIYGGMEIVWRGHTHWTMLLSGGACLVFIYIISNFSREPVWKKWIMSTLIITTVEFAVGITVNLHLGWNVWDYSSRPFNLMGQICPLYVALWFGLSILVVWACGYLRAAIHKWKRRLNWPFSALWRQVSLEYPKHSRVKFVNHGSKTRMGKNIAAVNRHPSGNGPNQVTAD